MTRLRTFEISPGGSLWYDSQKYRCEAFVTVDADEGRERTWAIFESRCPVCFRPFIVATVIGGEFKPNRRCQKHKAPGRPVFPKRRRKA